MNRARRFLAPAAGACLALGLFLLHGPARAEDPAPAQTPIEAPAQEQAPEVSAVEVEGNKIVSTTTILTKVKTRPGDRLNQQTVDEDI